MTTRQMDVPQSNASERDEALAPSAPPKPRTRHRAWSIASRIGLAVVGLIFLVAAAEKFIDPAPVGNVLYSDGVPPALIAPLVKLVTVAEFALGVFLLFGVGRRWVPHVAAGVLVIFMIQLGYLLTLDAPPDCGCARMITPYDTPRENLIFGLARNAVMIALLELSWFFGRRAPA